MPDTDSTKSSSYWSTILSVATVLFATALGYKAVSPYLASDRPVASENSKSVVESGKKQSAKTRLWQDPLNHLEEFKSPSKSSSIPGGVNLGSLKCALKNITEEKGFDLDNMTYILCFVESGAQSEAVEVRRRTRNSVVSACGTAGYTPKDQDKISFATIQCNFDNLTNNIIVPYEIYENKNKRCILFWIDDEQVPDKHALIFANKVYCELGLSNISEKVPTKSTDWKRFRLLCCTGTDLILALKTSVTTKGDWKSCVSNSYNSFSKNTLIISCDSTVTQVRTEFAKHKVQYGYIVNDSGDTKSSFEFRFTIGTDEHLAKLVRKELEVRKVWWNKRPGNPAIAVICEWDSNYGRRMAETYRKTLSQYDVHIYRYLRGIDGQIPKPAEKGDAEKKKDNRQIDAAIAEGDAQYDYLLRMVQRMKKTANYVAIGLLGQDAYDSLLMLKTMRSSFPDTQFFTHDLDARLLQPGQYEYTRNVLVASHFGLELHPFLQRSVMPFRSSYGSARYFAALHALDYSTVEVTDPKDRFGINQHTRNHIEEELKDLVEASSSNDESRFARIYEIGKGGAFELSYDPTLQDRARELGTDQIRDIPRITTISVGWQEGFAVIISIISITALVFMFSSKVSVVMANTMPDKYVITSILIAVFLFILSAWYSSNSPYGEPFLFTSGISVWPTNAIRLIAFIMSILFVRNYRLILGDRWDKLTRWLPSYMQIYCKKDTRHSINFQGSSWWDGILISKTWRAAIKYWRVGYVNSSEKGKDLSALQVVKGGVPNKNSVDVGILLLRGLFLGQWPQRMMRTIILHVIVLILFIGLFILSEGMITPARGTLAIVISGILFVASELFGLLFILLFLIDTTMLTNRFLKVLDANRAGLAWPSLEDEAKVLPQGLNSELCSKAQQGRLLVQFVAEMTDVIARMIHYPFIILAILILAHSSIFDSWRFTEPQILIGLFAITTLLSCALLMQFNARKIKERVLRDIDKLLIPLPSPLDEDMLRERPILPDEKTIKFIENTRDQVQKISGGAFKPLMSNPITLSLIYPIVSFVGGNELLDLIRPLINLFL